MDIKYRDGQIVYKIINGKIIKGEIIKGWTDSCKMKWEDSDNIIVGSPAHYLRGKFFLTYEDACKARNLLFLQKVPKFLILVAIGTLLLGPSIKWGFGLLLGFVVSGAYCLYEISTIDNPTKDSWEPRDFGDYGDHGDSGGF